MFLRHHALILVHFMSFLILQKEWNQQNLMRCTNSLVLKLSEWVEWGTEHANQAFILWMFMHVRGLQITFCFAVFAPGVYQYFDQYFGLNYHCWWVFFLLFCLFCFFHHSMPTSFVWLLVHFNKETLEFLNVLTFNLFQYLSEVCLYI